MDEHRVGLIPILRRVWAPRGRRPRAVVRPRYQWVYLVGFVHPESGETSFWIVPELTAAVFAAVFAAFVEEQGFNENKRLLLGATTAQGGIRGPRYAPPRTRFIQQPPYSQLQPSERLWPISTHPGEPVVQTIQELEEVRSQRAAI